MPISEESIQVALSRVIEPDLKKDILTLDLVREVLVDENTVTVHVEVEAQRSGGARETVKVTEAKVVYVAVDRGSRKVALGEPPALSDRAS